MDASGAVYALIYASEDVGLSPRVLGLEPDGSTRLSADVGDYLQQPMGCLTQLVTHFRTSVVLGDGGRIYFGSEDGKLHILSP
ncbi:MAG: hypothetical protein ABI333_05770 [bacterium]